MSNNKWMYLEQNPSPDDFHIEGITILDDLDSFSNLKRTRVIVFNDTPGANKAIDELEKTGDLDIAFQAALNGDAEELSIERLVAFYLANGM